MLTRIAIPAILSYFMSHPWPVELLRDHLLRACLAEMTTRVVIFS